MYGGTIEANEHFALLAREQVSKISDEISLLNLHCNIILSLYEFNHGHEHRAWLRIGIAARLCQALGIAFESNYDDIVSVAEAETRRRTFWSVYVIERLLVNGHDRPLLQSSTPITVCLPASTADFTHGRSMLCTGSLLDSPTSNNNLQSFMIHAVDLLSSIVEWGGAGMGGRHSDPRMPWLEGMPYSRLEKRLHEWRNSLPTYLLFTDAHIKAHSETGEGRLFGLMHLFYLTASVRLYRKYLPFMPPPAYDPATDGPIDGPELMPAPAVPGFWGTTTQKGVRCAASITAAFVKLREHNLDPWLLPFSGLSLMESSSMHVFCVHSEWKACEEFVGEPAKSKLASNLRYLVRMQENWPIAAFWVRHAKLLLVYPYLKVSPTSASFCNRPPGQKSEVR